MKKILSLGVILLFIGLVLNPIILSDEIFEAENNYEQVKVEFYGADKVDSYTIDLTREESEKIDTILNEFKCCLNNATSKDEMYGIYVRTLAELRKYNVINDYFYHRTSNLISNYFSLSDNENYQKDFLGIDVKVNYFVLIALKADFANFMSPIFAITYNMIFNHDFCEQNFPLFTAIFDIIFVILMERDWPLLEFIFDLIPINYDPFGPLFGILLLGFLWVYFFNIFPIGYSVSLSYSNFKNDGWVYALGLRGTRVIEGEYQGALAGFTGLRIFKDSDFYMYGFALGSALGE